MALCAALAGGLGGGRGARGGARDARRLGRWLADGARAAAPGRPRGLRADRARAAAAGAARDAAIFARGAPRARPGPAPLAGRGRARRPRLGGRPPPRRATAARSSAACPRSRPRSPTRSRRAARCGRRWPRPPPRSRVRRRGDGAGARRARARRPDPRRRSRRCAGALGSPRVDSFAAALLSQQLAGGDLAALLRRFAAAAAERDRAEADARSATAQARFTGLLVVAMPAGAALFAELLEPGFVGRAARRIRRPAAMLGACRGAPARRLRRDPAAQPGRGP